MALSKKRAGELLEKVMNSNYGIGFIQGLDVIEAESVKEVRDFIESSTDKVEMLVFACTEGHLFWNSYAISYSKGQWRALDSNHSSTVIVSDNLDSLIKGFKKANDAKVDHDDLCLIEFKPECERKTRFSEYAMVVEFGFNEYATKVDLPVSVTKAITSNEDSDQILAIKKLILNLHKSGSGVLPKTKQIIDQTVNEILCLA